jgi:hypothetical protein
VPWKSAAIRDTIAYRPGGASNTLTSTLLLVAQRFECSCVESDQVARRATVAHSMPNCRQWSLQE